MEFKATGNVMGNTITLENKVPIRGRVTVIIHQEEDIISQELILSFLKEKLPEWKDLYNVEKIGIFGSFARVEQTSDSDIRLNSSYTKDIHSVSLSSSNSIELGHR